MRNMLIALFVAMPLLAQPAPRNRPPIFRGGPGPQAAEASVKQSMEALAAIRKTFEHDVDVLNHLRAADDALVDSMQPSIAIQKAYEEVEEAKRLSPEFTTMQGVIKAERELEGARRSPISADFGHLRTILRDEAVGPASRVVIRNAQRLQEETVAWIKVQELISAHVRALSEIAATGLQATQK
ncbi:MAG TPA: hypothetical protein VG323_12515 [Thermoanaerobaculia bacterium]|nr:hypothetical protein [Thermoanaerobaculia bacterium]